jgi:RHH-type rel operon transcriptional repressor/antitoxin RelB
MSRIAAQTTSTLSVRILPKTRKKLENLSKVTDRTLSYLAGEALDQYLEVQSWQVKGIESALQEADSKDAKFYEHTEIETWLKSWGTKSERAAPK